MERVKSLPLLAVACLTLLALPPASSVGGNYDQSVWFKWDHKQLDVLVLYGKGALIGPAIQRAITMWENGIAQLAPSLGVTFRVYWADSGVPPPPGFREDIVVVPQGFAAVRPLVSGGPCIATAPMVAGWGSFIRVTSHEFGHCLGLTHVFTNGAEYKPSFDILGDGDGDKCPSNLNIQVLQRVFSGQTGQVSVAPSSYFQAAGC